MIERWLGAFKKKQSLYNSLVYEIEQREKVHVAAEMLQAGKSYINHAKVGLLVKNSALVRRFNGDVYSVYKKTSSRTKTLKKTRSENSAYSFHRECFVRPEYIGVVLKFKKTISKTALQAIKNFSLEYNCPVFELINRRLYRIKFI